MFPLLPRIKEGIIEDGKAKEHAGYEHYENMTISVYHRIAYTLSLKERMLVYLINDKQVQKKIWYDLLTVLMKC